MPAQKQHRALGCNDTMFATALKRRLRRTTFKLVAGAAVLARAGTTAGTGSATAVPVLASGSSSTPPGMPAVQWDRWPEWNVWDNLLNTSYTNKHTSWNDWTPSTHDSEQAREDRCRVGNVLHQGGPQVRTLARTALAGTDADRRTALGGDSGQDSPIGQAAQRDWAASPPPSGFATAQQQRWLDEINKFDYQFNPPEFDTQIRDFVRGSDHRTYDALDADVVPRAGQAQRDQVVAMVSQLKNTDQYLQAFTTFENQLAAVSGASSPVDITEIA